jgi:7-cyano-7-deazaguanine synthase
MGAIVLLSGGQDSATAALWMRKNLEGPYVAMTFRYGQRHVVELEAARAVAEALGIEQVILDIGPLWGLLEVESALTSEKEIKVVEGGLPTTFVPGRNLVFLLLAAVWGYPRGYRHLVIGANEVDYSGYPDCRGPFLEAAQRAISLALDEPYWVHAPFLRWNKAALWRYAAEEGALDLIREKTHTCYRGVREVPHPWGYGCGVCPACELRRRGYEEAFGAGAA